jgi:hypothetical protein
MLDNGKALSHNLDSSTVSASGEWRSRKRKKQGWLNGGAANFSTWIWRTTLAAPPCILALRDGRVVYERQGCCQQLRIVAPAYRSLSRASDHSRLESGNGPSCGFLSGPSDKQGAVLICGGCSLGRPWTNLGWRLGYASLKLTDLHIAAWVFQHSARRHCGVYC